MKLIGQLGIDPKLLLAQILNFGILLWLLTKFLYKPLIRHIEADEKELKQAEEQRKALIEERVAFNRQREKEEKQLRQKAQKIIEKAEKIAQSIRTEAQREAEKDLAELLKQFRSSNKAQSQRLKKELLTSFSSYAAQNLKQELATLTKEKALQKKMQEYFFKSLLKKLNALQISQLEKYKLSLLKEKKYSQSKQKKSIVFSLAPKSIPKAILESAAPTALSKKRALKQLLLRKTGVPFQVNYKINQGLISGFRLELLGVVIESNLLSLIQNATKIK